LDDRDFVRKQSTTFDKEKRQMVFVFEDVEGDEVPVALRKTRRSSRKIEWHQIHHHRD